jgi:hypothetical protein
MTPDDFLRSITPGKVQQKKNLILNKNFFFSS